MQGLGWRFWSMFMALGLLLGAVLHFFSVGGGEEYLPASLSLRERTLYGFAVGGLTTIYLLYFVRKHWLPREITRDLDSQRKCQRCGQEYLFREHVAREADAKKLVAFLYDQKVLLRQVEASYRNALRRSLRSEHVYELGLRRRDGSELDISHLRVRLLLQVCPRCVDIEAAERLLLALREVRTDKL